MSKIIQAFIVTMTIGLAAMYFTTANPVVTAVEQRNDEAVGAILVNIISRLNVIEAKLKIKVPEDQVVEIKHKN